MVGSHRFTVLRRSTVSKLAIEHPYYCSDSNYYSNEPSQRYKTVNDFLEAWNSHLKDDSLIDMNLIFRFDVHQNRDDNDDLTDGYWAEVFIIQQRKGIFVPINIEKYESSDDEKFEDVLKRHWIKLKELWNPISIDKKDDKDE